MASSASDPAPDAVARDRAYDCAGGDRGRCEHRPPHREVLEAAGPVIERELDPDQEGRGRGDEEHRPVDLRAAPARHVSVLTAAPEP